LIYADASALVKLVLPEAESSAMVELAKGAPRLVTSALGATEMRRAVRRDQPERLWAVEKALSEIAIVEISHEVLRIANVLGPITLRTLDAIHLASALFIREEIDSFVVYDTRLAEAARAAGLPVVSPQ
jgi:predicted nucleic acid-binding protein